MPDNSLSLILGPESILSAPKKITVLRLRWLVIITCAYMLLSVPDPLLDLNFVHGFVLLYLATDLALYFVKETLFESSYFYTPLVVFDTLTITASLVVTQQVETDFYLAYFLVIILCAVWKDLRWSVSVTGLIAVAYGYLLLTGVDRWTASIVLRVPFLFVISLFYSYFVQLVATERSLRQKAEEEARRDPLTALYTRREFDQRIVTEFERAKRYQRNLAVLMVDVDNFKNVNDTHGHQWGDRVLQTIADQLRLRTRLSDIVCRFGGEEFVILLPETALKESLAVADRIREEIKQQTFQPETGAFTVTVSIGVSSTSTKDYSNFDDLLFDADRMLYVAKNNGKDRIAVSPLTTMSLRESPAG
jgi:diguanylate cyclase (GGDEF)-like protein